MLSALLSTLPFAALAAADLTTSLWGPYATLPELRSMPERVYYASVVNVDNDRTTFAVRGSYVTEPSKTLPNPEDLDTLTVGPSYYNVTSPFTGRLNLTNSVECTSSSQNAAIVCTQIINGPYFFSSICSEATNMTMNSTQSIESSFSFCLTETTVPRESLATTITVGEHALTTSLFKYIITAGEEKLSATTGATPTNTGPPATGAATTGSGTGGAGPMRTSAPLLAGLGAAMAVFVL